MTQTPKGNLTIEERYAIEIISKCNEGNWEDVHRIEQILNMFKEDIISEAKKETQKIDKDFYELKQKLELEQAKQQRTDEIFEFMAEVTWTFYSQPINCSICKRKDIYVLSDEFEHNVCYRCALKEFSKSKFKVR